MTDDNHTTKSCSHCGVVQPATIEFFISRIKNTDGLGGMCKGCHRKASARSRATWVPPSVEGAVKLCNLCQSEKPATTEFFQTQVLGKYGLRAQCRTCRTALNEARSKAFAEEQQKTFDVVPTKVCTKCQEAKPATLEFFRPRAEGHDGLRAQCRTCHDPSIHRWGEEHPEEVRAAILRWHAEHPEERRRSWKLNNPAAHARRRARQLALPVQFTKDDWLFCLNYWAYSCAICGNQEGFLWCLAADHWIPLVDQEHCPGTVPWNILPLCHGQGGCNNTKHAQEPRAWLEKKIGKGQAKKKIQDIAQYFALAKTL